MPIAFSTSLRSLAAEQDRGRIFGLALALALVGAWAVWLLRAIVVENVSVRREGNVLYFPVGPDFRVAEEIRNIITVVAKTNHYWQEHIAASAVRS